MIQSPKILIVEDEAVLAYDLTDELEQLGYDVVGTANSGRDALNKIKDRQPDLALVDIKLRGEMDGIQVAELMSSQYGIGIIYLTAYTEKKLVDRAKVTEPFGFLVKPISPSELQATIETATYKMNAEKLLRQSEEFNRLLVMHSPLPTIYVNAEGIIEFANPASNRLFDVPEDEQSPLLGDNVFDLPLVAQQPHVVHGFQRLMQGEPQSELELAYRSPLTGKEYTLLMSAAPRPGENGTVSGAIVSFMDISDRKKAEHILEESEKKYREFADFLPEFVCEIDTNHYLTFVNRAGLETSGYTEQDIQNGLKILDLVTQRDRDMLAAQLDGALRGEELGGLEYEAITKDGSKIPVTIYTAPMVVDGETVGIRAISVDITERKSTEEALRVSESRYRLIVEHASEAILVVQDGMIKFLNPRCVDITDFTHDELLRLPFGDLIHPDDRPMALQYHERRLSGDQELFRFPFRIFTKDGSIKWLELTAGAITWEERPAGLCLINDITERKRSNEALRKSEEKYRTLVQALPNIVFTYDLRGNLLFVNQAFSEILQYDAENAYGRNILDFIHPEEVDSIKNNKKLFMSGHPVKNIVCRIKTGNGEYLSMRISGYPIPDETGNTVAILGIAQDITDSMRSEEALRDSEERYRQLTENSLTGVFIQEYGPFSYVNTRLADMLGYHPEEMVGKHIMEFVHPDDRDLVHAKKVKRIRGQDVPTQYEFRALCKDGGFKWLEIFAARIQYQGRSVIIGNVIDISERKIAQEALHKSEKRLELALKGAKMGLWDWNLQTGEAVWSDTVIEAFGYSAEEIQTNLKTWKEAVHPEDWPELSKAFNDNIRGIKPFFEKRYRLKTKSGEWIWVHARGTVVAHDEHGQPLRMAGTIIDITEHVKAETELERTRVLLEAIIDQSPAPMVMVLKDGTIVMFNEACLDHLGIADESEIKRGINLFTMKKTWKEFDSEGNPVPMDQLPLAKALNGITTIGKEMRVIRKDGSERWEIVHSTPVYDSRGNLIAAFIVFSDITERKLTEQALIESEERYRTLFERAGDGIIVVDAEGDSPGMIVSANSVAAEMHGYTVEEFMRLNMADLDIPDEAEKMEDVLNRVRRGELVKIDHYHRRSDGSILPLELSTGLIEIRGHQYLLSVNRDITDRIKADAEHANHIRFLQSMDRIERAMADTTDLEEMMGKVLQTAVSIFECDRAWLMYPCDPEASMTRVMKEIISPNCPSTLLRSQNLQVAPDLAECFKIVMESRIPVIFHPSEGSPLPDAAKAVSIKSSMNCALFPNIGKPWMLGLSQCSHGRIWSDDDLLLFKEVSNRISDSLNALILLRNLGESEKRYRTLFEESIDGILVVHPNGTIIDANQAFCTLLGGGRDEIIGCDIKDFYWNPDDRQYFVEEIERQGFIKDFEWCARSKNNSQKICIVASTAWKDKDGVILAYLSIIRDVTQSRLLEEQLIQAQKMEAIGTLAGGIAHDFNNLLQVIHGYADMALLDIKKGQVGHTEMQEIKRASRSAAELTRGLLTFSRRLEGKPRPINVNREIEQVTRMLNRTIPKMIEIELRLAKTIHTVNSDPAQLHQVLMNLAVNARDAMPDGGKLTISTENVYLDREYCRSHLDTKPGNYVLLAISDTGFGMDKKTAAQIFDPFFSTKEPGKGTGLGLSIVFGIVKNCNGNVICYSEPGYGTTFKVYLPALKRVEEEEPDVTQTSFKGGTETILFVDDETAVRKLATDVLIKFGYEVLTANDGLEGLEVFVQKKDTISLVILDLIMPKMGGRDCMQEILKVDPSAKVIIATGYAANGEIDQALEEGARAKIRKPYEARQMLEIVRETLDEA